ncbi:Pre-mRNA-splicing factor of RES complex-domain-containing protein [Annulohypoxylon maeteangense]|uniref:Pre-mRNA-splicing factor of RES complex-domain-containing protein n=1 Tax=Annulohypoxylon maeteangense TaxID=1927788 RepID=UPI002007EB15|nr:Pre-mRNA-splicing factor of RES complex-domain-containing protein [Annulohypoxylon maeteangense]KAI0889778.1 Pre-mRNA-splicing factor of RES complex-domain-containing protein [Annulohypoxylon maeteangense]
MSSYLSNYLATHYLVADPKPSKKRKRKQDATSGLVIADESEESNWARASQAQNDDDAAVVAGTSTDFRKSKKSAWKVVGGSAPNQQPSTTAEDADSAQRADAILASAALEASTAQASASASDAPTVLMSDGTHAGLQTASAVATQLSLRRQAERSTFPSSHKEAETVYRDATGRRVDVSMKRAELRKAAQEAARAEEAKKEAMRGDVQIEASRRRREELEDAKVMAVARHADDLDLNREMKDAVRWGDTMAQFIEPRSGGGGGGGGGGSGKGEKRMKGKPVYKGAWTPNRYGIKPGYRWDGVDRGNGFEGERFKAINRRERNKGLEYSWQMDE